MKEMSDTPESQDTVHDIPKPSVTGHNMICMSNFSNMAYNIEEMSNILGSSVNDYNMSYCSDEADMV